MHILFSANARIPFEQFNAIYANPYEVCYLTVSLFLLFFSFVLAVSAFINCAIRFFRFLDEQNNLYIQSYNGSIES